MSSLSVKWLGYRGNSSSSNWVVVTRDRLDKDMIRKSFRLCGAVCENEQEQRWKKELFNNEPLNGDQENNDNGEDGDFKEEGIYHL